MHHLFATILILLEGANFASENHKEAFRCLPGEKQYFALAQVDFGGSLRDVDYLLAGQASEERCASQGSGSLCFHRTPHKMVPLYDLSHSIPFGCGVGCRQSRLFEFPNSDQINRAFQKGKVEEALT